MWHNLSLFLDILELRIKTKFKFEVKLFVNVAPDLWTQSSFVHKTTIKKSTKTEEKNFFQSFTFLPVTLKLAYFAALNGARQICPVNANYPRCLENSNISIFCWQVGSLCGVRFQISSLFDFFACQFKFRLLCTPNWWGSNFSSKLQLPKMPGKL